MNFLTINENGSRPGIPIEEIAGWFKSFPEGATVDDIPKGLAINWDWGAARIETFIRAEVDRELFPSPEIETNEVSPGILRLPLNSVSLVTKANQPQMAIKVDVLGRPTVKKVSSQIQSVSRDPLNLLRHSFSEMFEFRDLTDDEHNAIEWLTGPSSVGASSATLCHVLIGLPEDLPKGKLAHPHDADDFRRCAEFFNAVPSAKEDIGKMRPVSIEWNNLVDVWDELTAFYEKNCTCHAVKDTEGEKTTMAAFNRLFKKALATNKKVGPQL